MKNNTFTAVEILLPRKKDQKNWAVIACDQYTSEPEYWHETAEIVGETPSALRLILPEVYLEEPDVMKRIGEIHTAMREMLDSDIFMAYPDAMIYTERVQSDGKLRCGIVGAIDLEQYDYQPGSTTPVRATEKTVPERLPPRVKIRDGAALELPHIMILIDDTAKTVIEPLSMGKETMTQVYACPLMQGGGEISGWLLEKSAQEGVLQALGKLSQQEESATPLVYAVGDGNHSLAAAKAYYEQLKAQHPDEDLTNHPARWALAEIVNLHSPALEFEAIHRIITGVDADVFRREFMQTLGAQPADTLCLQCMTLVYGEQAADFAITKPTSALSVGSVQHALDDFVRAHGGKIDYIHGADTVRRLAKNQGCVGIILPPMKKTELFSTVVRDGALPRKTFSMGHAQDKRYYMECRKIIR